MTRNDPRSSYLKSESTNRIAVYSASTCAISSEAFIFSAAEIFSMVVRVGCRCPNSSMEMKLRSKPASNPVDAVKDAELLAMVLGHRADHMQAAALAALDASEVIKPAQKTAAESQDKKQGHRSTFTPKPCWPFSLFTPSSRAAGCCLTRYRRPSAKVRMTHSCWARCFGGCGVGRCQWGRSAWRT